MEGITIRDMVHDDLPEVLALEKRCFAMPWIPESFRYELNSNDAILKVAIMNKRIIAYICLRVILDMTHIMDIAVMPEFRRMGFGSLLFMNALQDLKMIKPETKQMTLEVRESNIAAIRLYEKFGFSEIGRRRGYYQKPPEDAVIMECGINKNFSKKRYH